MFNGPWSTNLYDPSKEACLYQLMDYISGRINYHESVIKDTLKYIRKGDVDTIKRLSPVLEREEIRINELEAVLKYFHSSR